MQIKLETEYIIAERKGKLGQHLKKFTFDFDENWFIKNYHFYLLIIHSFSFDLIIGPRFCIFNISL